MINEIKRMQQLAGINEIKVRRPNSIENIKKFYDEHIGREWDGEDEDAPDWGGIDNLIDAGPDEFYLDSFLSRYNEVLSEEDIILLWLYCYSDYLNGDINDKEELEGQVRDLGYSDDDINYFVNIIKDATST